MFVPRTGHLQVCASVLDHPTLRSLEWELATAPDPKRTPPNPKRFQGCTIPHFRSRNPTQGDCWCQGARRSRWKRRTRLPTPSPLRRRILSRRRSEIVIATALSNTTRTRLLPQIHLFASRNRVQTRRRRNGSGTLEVFVHTRIVEQQQQQPGRRGGKGL